jgi:hypothetical protein
MARTGEKRNIYSVLVGEPEEKRALERTRRRRKDTIKMDLKRRGWEGVDWVHLGREKWWNLLNSVMKLHAP